MNSHYFFHTLNSNNFFQPLKKRSILFPDTYVKTYLCEDERRFLKRRSCTVRHSNDPMYRHTIRYLATDVPRRTLLALIWGKRRPEPGYPEPQRQVIRGGAIVTEPHPLTQCLGICEIDVDRLRSKQLTVGWYRLFPPVVYQVNESDSN